jgi:hypothetical protein
MEFQLPVDANQNRCIAITLLDDLVGVLALGTPHERFVLPGEFGDGGHDARVILDETSVELS